MIRDLRRFANDFAESIRIAVEQLRVHKFRSLLTALGVIIGVWAVISIGVAIDGLNRGFNKSLDMLGSDLFYVEKWPWRDVGDDWMDYRNRPGIQVEYAEELNEIISQTPNSRLVVAVPVSRTQRTVSRNDLGVGQVSLSGTNSDFDYISTARIEYGRFFTHAEAFSGLNVIVLGSQVAESLFPEGSDRAIGGRVKISGLSYTVIGVYEEQGSFLAMMSFDNQAVLPLASLRKFYAGRRWWGGGDLVNVMKKPDADREEARDEIVGAMRRIRGLLPDQPDNFEVNASDAVESSLGPVQTGLAIAGFAITGLSLFVGAIGIMNITFVSVKERTREIGTRRAVGARRSSILMQFLVEAVAICLLGGLIGLASAYITMLAVVHFLPWFLGVVSPLLISLAVLISIGVGIASGFVPALLASRLDPATALRHE